MGNLCIIPARGGSKRIPRKNIRDFFGKPIIAYSIELAIQSNIFDEVLVSTDDEEIAEISKKYGAKVPFMRSEENSSDFSGTMDVINEILNRYKNASKYQYLCCIYPCAPLINVEHLIHGYKKVQEPGFSLIYPLVAYSYPIWRGVIIDNFGKVKTLWDEHKNSRSQDLPKVYHDAGQWYWFEIEKINNPENIGAVILSEETVQDIDTFSDWALAEMKYKLIKSL